MSPTRSRAVLAVLSCSLLLGCTAVGSPASEPTPTATPSPPPMHPRVDALPYTPVRLAPPDGPRFVVRVAATPDARQSGLMHVEHVPDGTGMLFVFPTEHEGAFWMRDTLVPLDIAFLDEDGVVLAILEMEPCEEDPCPLYDPGVTYRSALEVAQGTFASAGLSPGARIEVGPLPAAS